MIGSFRKGRPARTTVNCCLALIPTLVLTGLVPAGVAIADPGRVFNDPYQELMMRERPQVEAANRVLMAVEASPGSGFTSIELHEGGLRLWWKGAVAPDVERVLAQVAKDIQVEIRPSAYSREQLLATSRELRTLLSHHGGARYFTIIAYGDGSGLSVDTDLPAAALDAVTARRRVLAGVDATTMVPVTRTTGYGQLRSESRLNDGVPWKGGARIENREAGDGYVRQCSSGFGVRIGSTEYLMTAAHCGTPPNRFRDPTGELIGTAALEHWEHDILLIRTNADWKIYDGALGRPEFTKGVVGWAPAVPNSLVCHSGSISRVRCGIRITNNVDVSGCYTDSDGDHICVTDLILARSTNGTDPSVVGDSGGPVFTLSGSTNVWAVGTITGGLSGDPTSMVFQDFITAYRDFGVQTI